MKLFFRGLFACLWLLGGLSFTGCSSPSTSDQFFQVDTPQPRSASATATDTTSAQLAANVARFRVGQTVIVTFSGTPELIEPHEETIKEDGNITLPLIGSVQALGKTAGQLQNEIHNLYVPQYYVRLNVTVKPGDLVYYVRGEVKAPGRQLYIGETTVTKAITSAGDFTDYASHKVTLIRASGGSIRVNVDKALEDPTLDPQIYPGDQVTVPRRLF